MPCSLGGARIWGLCWLSGPSYKVGIWTPTFLCAALKWGAESQLKPVSRVPLEDLGFASLTPRAKVLACCPLGLLFCPSAEAFLAYPRSELKGSIQAEEPGELG